MSELERLREENAQLRAQLVALKLSQEHTRASAKSLSESDSCSPSTTASWDGARHGLSKDQIARYSRQLILHSFGAHAQSKLCRGSVIIVGAGGLGSPAALYLAAAGVGRIGIVDKDSVELNNLHRQIIHRESSVGLHKCTSAASACTALNSSIAVETHTQGFTPANAVDLVRQYDVVVDASDNAPTRYLISDACAVTKRPLVSGAAIGMDGQLTVYCHGEDGPCYRCLFPTAPRPESCSRCCDAGVLGAVPGVIGTLQAVEAIKLLSGVGDPMSRRLLLVDTLSARFHVVKLRGRSPDCVACGDTPSITATTLARYNYTAFTGQAPSDSAPAPLDLIPEGERITAAELQRRVSRGPEEGRGHRRPYVVLDVRPREQFDICHLPGALHAPFAKLDAHMPAVRSAMMAAAAAGAGEGARGGPAGPPVRSRFHAAAGALPETQRCGTGVGCGRGSGAVDEQEGGGREDRQPQQAVVDVYVVCRRGNDSQRAVAALRSLGITHAVDVIGGMEAWAQEVDPAFPLY